MLSLPNLSALWIGKYVTGSFRDQHEVLSGLEQMIEDDVMTKILVNF
jgi:hypothetical protein